MKDVSPSFLFVICCVLVWIAFRKKLKKKNTFPLLSFCYFLSPSYLFTYHPINSLTQTIILCVFAARSWNHTHTHTHTYIHTDKQTLAGVCIQMAALKRTWSQSCFRSGAPWGKPSRYFAKDRNCSSTALVMWTRDDWTKERKCKPWFKQTECSCKPLFCLGTKNGVKHVNKYTFILITGHDLTYRAPSTCFKCYLHPYSTQDA